MKVQAKIPMRRKKKKATRVVTNEKLVNKKQNTEEGQLILKVNNFTKRFGDEIIDELLASIKYTMHRNAKLMECAEIFLRDTMDDLKPTTERFIVEKRAAYLLLMSLPITLTDTQKQRIGFWFGEKAKNIEKMSARELEIKGGSMDGYARGTKLGAAKTTSEGATTSTKEKRQGTKKKNGGMGIGQAIMQKLKSNIDMTFEEAEKIAKEINPDTRFSQASFAWYKNKVKKG